MRYLAIDHGHKRTGLAVCDENETIASPLKVIEGQKILANEIKKIVTEYNIAALVIGLPLNMDGTEGPRTKQVREFAESLKDLNIPIHFQDERLSSFQADEKLIPMELTRGKKKQRKDAIAAAEILQTFLDSKKPE